MTDGRHTANSFLAITKQSKVRKLKVVDTDSGSGRPTNPNRH